MPSIPKRGDRTRCVATPKHIDNAQKLFFSSLEELDTILRLVVFLLLFCQHFGFAVVEHGKQLSVIFVVEVVVFIAEIVPCTETSARNGLELASCLLFYSIRCSVPVKPQRLF